jgi:parallel beta-helix repeat protein
MRTTSKTIKRARVSLMAVLVLSMLSIGVHPRAASALPAPPIPVNSCGTVINQPGNYILTNNLTCAGTGTAVEISGQAFPGNSFHFNLNGFTISGDGTGTGIYVRVGANDASGDYSRVGTFIYGGTVIGFGVGIGIEQSNGVHLNNMSVTGNRAGVRIFGGSLLNHISDNTITSNGLGIELREGFANHISSNTITNNTIGINLRDSASNTISGNTALGNRFRDLSDGNPCDNSWRDNTFVTDSEGDGPGVGCIQ